MYLLSHKHCEVTDDGKKGRNERCFPHFIKTS